MVRQRTGGPPQTVKVVTSTENPQPAARPAHGQGDHFGRSPDLRVNALPGLPNPLSRGDQWHMPTSLAAYSCGGSPGVGLAPSPGSLFIRRGDAGTEALSDYSGRFQDAMRDASPSMLETTNGSRKQKGGALAPLSVSAHMGLPCKSLTLQACGGINPRLLQSACRDFFPATDR